MVGTSIHSNGGDLYSPHSNARWRATYVLHILSQVQSGTAMYIQVQPCDIQNVFPDAVFMWDFAKSLFVQCSNVNLLIQIIQGDLICPLGKDDFV